MLLVVVLLCASRSSAQAESTLVDRLDNSIYELSSHASRLTGYPGAEAAADWIEGQLLGMGIGEIHRHEFPLLMPIDDGFTLELDGQSLPIHGVWPNLIRTSTLPEDV